MTNPLTEARTALGDSLGGLGFNVYAGPPTQVTAPAAILTPGDPWSEPLTWSQNTVRIVVTLAAGALDSGEASLARLEQMVWDAAAKLRADGYGVDRVGVPRTLRIGQTDLAAVDLRARVQVADEPATERTAP